MDIKKVDLYSKYKNRIVEEKYNYQLLNEILYDNTNLINHRSIIIDYLEYLKNTFSDINLSILASNLTSLKFEKLPFSKNDSLLCYDYKKNKIIYSNWTLITKEMIFHELMHVTTECHNNECYHTVYKDCENSVGILELLVQYFSTRGMKNTTGYSWMMPYAEPLINATDFSLNDFINYGTVGFKNKLDEIGFDSDKIFNLFNLYKDDPDLLDRNDKLNEECSRNLIVPLLSKIFEDYDKTKCGNKVLYINSKSDAKINKFISEYDYDHRNKLELINTIKKQAVIDLNLYSMNIDSINIKYLEHEDKYTLESDGKQISYSDDYLDNYKYLLDSEFSSKEELMFIKSMLNITIREYFYDAYLTCMDTMINRFKIKYGITDDVRIKYNFDIKNEFSFIMTQKNGKFYKIHKDDNDVIYYDFDLLSKLYLFDNPSDYVFDSQFSKSYKKLYKIFSREDVNNFKTLVK